MGLSLAPCLKLQLQLNPCSSGVFYMFADLWRYFIADKVGFTSNNDGTRRKFCFKALVMRAQEIGGQERHKDAPGIVPLNQEQNGGVREHPVKEAQLHFHLHLCGLLPGPRFQHYLFKNQPQN